MDNSSFPKVLQFKGKTIPNSQLLRLQEWFSRYEFDVEHIKGQKNLIPNFLSRIQTPASPIFYTSPVFPVFMATRSTATSLPSKALMNHLLSLNHVPLPPQDIISSSIGPRHEMFMVPNPSGSSKCIIIKEERPNTPPQIYYQDSQDPEDDFLPLSQLLQEFHSTPTRTRPVIKSHFTI